MYWQSLAFCALRNRRASGADWRRSPLRWRSTLAKKKARSGRKSRHSGRKYIVYLHAAHSANARPDDTNPELICLCPAHHLKMDRALEARDRVSQRRRGYRITTTDSLLVEIRDAGIEIEEQSDGYQWSIAHLGLGGHATTAARAAGCALYQLRIDLEKHKSPSKAAAEKEQPHDH